MSNVLSKLSFLWPIDRSELKKFLPMGLLMMCVLFNYNVLRALKDALVVPNIGAEALSFIKLYFVVPFAIMFIIVYAKMTNAMSQKNIFYSFCMFFMAFFLLFGFVIYPNPEIFHPNQEALELLVSKPLHILGMEFDLSHFKWFFKIFAKWSYALFYIFAELWGSMMLSLLFWQFANHITKTTEAKRFYPMFGLIGNIGLLFGGILLPFCADLDQEYFSCNECAVKFKFLIGSITASVAVAIGLMMVIYYYIQKEVLTDKRYFDETQTAVKKKKASITLGESFKIIFSSKYLGLITILVFCYGMSINLVEGPWKAKLREYYPDTLQYTSFSGHFVFFTGLGTMAAMLIGSQVLSRVTWFTGAILTPLMIFVTGLLFFVFVVFDKNIQDVMNFALEFNLLFIAVMFGAIQNVLSKATKYAFFDPTKEMAYIPIDNELKTKGKAAVDVVGARLAKSSGAFVQSMIFILFPALTFTEIMPYLMIIFVIVSLIWMFGVKLLSVEYNKFFESKEKTS